jgi:stage III sporulation protein AH
LDIVDQLEENLSNSLISESTKEKFENFLLNKNNYIEKEKDIELMLQSKGYNESIAVVDADFIKVITNDTIEQADAIKILDVIVSETNYEPSQIKIVKFDNIDL